MSRQFGEHFGLILCAWSDYLLEIRFSVVVEEHTSGEIRSFMLGPIQTAYFS